MPLNSIVIVGEVNPYGANPYFALYHYPRRASGDRLREHLGLKDSTYDLIRKTNLCYGGRWSMKAARASMELILAWPFTTYVLLGAKVRSVFQGPDFFQIDRDGDKTVVTLPHPSGLNRLWNEPGARDRARSVMKIVAPSYPWGETDAA